jgi:glycerol-3-phosphate acyltransferase PlsX
MALQAGGTMSQAKQTVRIAIDAMGGDFGPSIIIPGAALARDRQPGIAYIFFGDEAQINPLLDKYPALKASSEVRHTSVVVKSDDKPSQALRAGRKVSSMWQAIEAVKTGQAAAAVSAGNTGALMAMSKICLHMTPGIDRPALAAVWPTVRGSSIVLDVGATIGADAHHLVDLAIMGSAMARILIGVARPSVGLLNVGVEEIKGLEEVKAASRRLRELDLPHLDYRGFVEGDDIGKGTVDVVVTEGFTGNIALKTAEGTARQIARYMREAMTATTRSKIGAFLAKDAFAELKKKITPPNGGLLLGLDGVIIKSHGGMDAVGFSAAIDMGYELARQDLLEKIRETLTLTLESAGESAPQSTSAAPSQTPAAGEPS